MQVPPRQAAAHLKASRASYIESQYRISPPLVSAEADRLVRIYIPFAKHSPVFDGNWLA